MNERSGLTVRVITTQSWSGRYCATVRILGRLPSPWESRNIRRLADAARGAVDELHELVGTLRGDAAAYERSPGPEAIGEAVAGFGSAGMAVTLRRQGDPRPVSAAAGQAAYRVVEEGL